MTNQKKTEVFEIKTTAGAILPLVGKLLQHLRTRRNPHNGYAEIRFEPDGIWIVCSEYGVRDLEVFIPRNQNGAFAALCAGDQYILSRRLYYNDLEELQTWLNGLFSERRIRIELESDERDICIESGGIRNYFGESDCIRPERMEMNFRSKISSYPDGIHISLPFTACGKEYDLYQKRDGTPILYGAYTSNPNLHPTEKLAGYRYVGTYPAEFRRINGEDWYGIVIAGFPDGDERAGVYTGRIAIGGGCIKFEREEEA